MVAAAADDEFVFAGLLETVPRIEAIGIALPKRANLDRKAKGLGLSEYQLQHA